jgi:hypothetical protein
MAVTKGPNVEVRGVEAKEERKAPLKVELVATKRWQDDAVAYGAILIAISALVVSIWQAQLSAKYSRLSVRPMLGTSKSFSESYEWTGLVLENRGIGPAMIRSAHLYLDNDLQGKMRLEEWEALLIKAGVYDKLRMTAYSLDEGSGAVIPTGANRQLLVITKGYPGDEMPLLRNLPNCCKKSGRVIKPPL